MWMLLARFDVHAIMRLKYFIIVMTHMEELLYFYAPYLILVGLGYVARVTNYMPQDMTEILGKYFVRFPIPATCFLMIAKFPLEKISVFALFAATFFCVLLAAFCICFLAAVFIGQSKSDAAAMATHATCPSISTLGLPLILALPGGADLIDLWSLAILIELLLISSLMVPLNDMTTGVITGGVLQRVGKSLQSPVIIASACGFLVAIKGWHVPTLATQYFQSIMAGLTAIVMLVLGGKFHTRGLVKPHVAELLVIGVKNLLMPAMTLVMCVFLGIKGAPAHVMLILSACPCSGLAPAITKNSHFGMRSAAPVMVFSLALSLLVMPFCVYKAVI